MNDADTRIDELAQRAAGSGGSLGVRELVRALDEREVFYSLELDESDGECRTSVVLDELVDSTYALTVFTDKSDPALRCPFAGDHLRSVLALAAQIPPARWLFVTAPSGVRVPVSKQLIRVILAEHEREDSAAARPRAQGRTVDELISDANVPEVLRCIAGRELYVEFSPGVPVIVASAVGGMEGLVQAHTSRRHAATISGAMTLEQIIDRLILIEALSGIHITNDHGDGVVVTRADLGLAGL